MRRGFIRKSSVSRGACSAASHAAHCSNDSPTGIGDFVPAWTVSLDGGAYGAHQLGLFQDVRLHGGFDLPARAPRGNLSENASSA